MEALFVAYFVSGVEIGDQNNLLAVAEGSGLRRTIVEQLYSTDLGMKEVLVEEAAFKALGIEFVPSLVVDGSVLFSGAAEPNQIAAALAGL